MTGRFAGRVGGVQPKLFFAEMGGIDDLGPQITRIGPQKRAAAYFLGGFRPLWPIFGQIFAKISEYERSEYSP